MTITLEQCFNPKLVQLEDIDVAYFVEVYVEFQSQTGSIRGRGIQLSSREVQSFNPKLVQLEDGFDLPVQA